MGLISRVSSRTYRSPKIAPSKMSEEDGRKTRENLATTGFAKGLGPVRSAPWVKKPKKKPLTEEQNKEKAERAAKNKERMKKAGENFIAKSAAHREKVKNMTAEEKLKYYEQRKEKRKITKAKNQAGLVFPVKRIARNMRKELGYIRFTQQSAVFTAAVLEYLTAEIMELAGNVASDFKVKTVTPRHVMLAIKNDEEIVSYFNKNKVILPSCGTIVKINHCLMQRKAAAMPASYWNELGRQEDDYGKSEGKVQVKKDDYFHSGQGQKKPVKMVKGEEEM